MRKVEIIIIGIAIFLFLMGLIDLRVSNRNIALFFRYPPTCDFFTFPIDAYFIRDLGEAFLIISIILIIFVYLISKK